jgi:hypothetical protein
MSGDDLMRIWLERSGGFAGRRQHGSLDSTSLSELQARQLAELLDRSHFFELPLRLESSSPGADRFSYRLTVETDSATHTVEAAEAAVPAELRPLLDWLTHSLFRK